LSHIKADVNKSARSIQTATMSVEKSQHSSKLNYALLEDEQSKREKVLSIYRPRFS